MPARGRQAKPENRLGHSTSPTVSLFGKGKYVKWPIQWLVQIFVFPRFIVIVIIQFLWPSFWSLAFLASLTPHVWISEPHRLEYGKCPGIWESDSHWLVRNGSRLVPQFWTINNVGGPKFGLSFPPSYFRKSTRWFEGVPTIFGNDIQKQWNIKGYEDMLCFFCSRSPCSTGERALHRETSIGKA